MSNPPTPEQARQAADILEAYGSSRYCPSARDKMTRGAKIGMALAAVTDDVVNVAVEMLQDWNFHLSVAAILAIEIGQGTVQREGRHLTITLPEHWQNM